MSIERVFFVRGRTGEMTLTAAEQRLRIGREAHETAATLRRHASLLDGLATEMGKSRPDLTKLAEMADRQRAAIVAATTRTLAIWQKVESPEVHLG